MKRNANGVFEVEIDKDLDGYMYLYEAKIFSYIYEVADPYSFALSSNSRFSYIISKEKIKKIASNYKSLSKLSSKFEYIIYECSVRDMTSKLDVKNKCTYEALSKTTGILTSGGIKTGIDYLASLNVTHVQLMPVLDFYTVNEDRPYQSYNWGYDPYFFFCNEGSYSTCPDDPYTRLFELKNLIAAFHDKNIRVILDVVYNHVFSTDDNPLNILVPKYYFRLNPNGSLSNGSGCGNDFESTHYMARKLIIDSINYYIDYFDVDGFRFDLMGIIDIKTMELAYNEAKKRKDDIFFLGEGWDLWTNLKVSEKCSINNASKLPYICYFNDRFRDVVKGQTSESQLSIKGYLSGDVNYRDGFKHVMLGSCKPLAFAPLFSSPEQSINYLECHDNHTLFDKLKTCLPYESDDITIKRIKLCIAATMLAVGIPFFHQGEEIGQSKRGNGNSYNSGDEINGFDYQLLDKRKDLYNYFKQCTYLKKLMLSFAKDNNMSFNDSIEIEDISYGGILFKYSYNQSTFFAFFNPTYDSFTYESNSPLKLIFSEKNGLNKLDTSSQNVIINPISFAVYIRGDDKND